MVKWCNGEMIPDGAAMMARQFCCRNCAIINLHVGVNFVVGVHFPLRDVFRGIFTRALKWNISSLRTTIGKKVIPRDVLG